MLSVGMLSVAAPGLLHIVNLGYFMVQAPGLRGLQTLSILFALFFSDKEKCFITMIAEPVLLVVCDPSMNEL